MKALKILKTGRDYYQSLNCNESIIEQYDEAIKELELYLSKIHNYPPCDNCGKEVDYMPWHYSTETERHLHSCNEC